MSHMTATEAPPNNLGLVMSILGVGDSDLARMLEPDPSKFKSQRSQIQARRRSTTPIRTGDLYHYARVLEVPTHLFTMSKREIFEWFAEHCDDVALVTARQQNQLELALGPYALAS